jgi:hypothetical protein
MTKTKEPVIGRRYDRDEIHEMFGGSKQSALPFNNGVPVCGCYTPEMNPNAPEVILVGVGKYKEHYSQMAAEQNMTLPIFLKRAVNEFEFMGYYRAINYSIDRNEIEENNTTDRPHNTISGVLYFEEAKTK